MREFTFQITNRRPVNRNEPEYQAEVYNVQGQYVLTGYGESGEQAEFEARVQLRKIFGLEIRMVQRPTH